MTKKEALIYMAGFFDGEGYVGILKRKRKDWNFEYFIQVSIGQNDGGQMDWVAKNFGGHVHQIKRDNSYFWIVSNNDGYNFLKLVAPHLKYKKPQAELAIKFYEERDLRRPIPKKELERRERIFQELKAMKKIFTDCPSVRRFND